MKSVAGRLASWIGGALLASTAITTSFASDVTPDRLMNAAKEPQNWLMVNKDYSNHRYSELDTINKDNVKNLHVAFTVAIGGAEGGGSIPQGGHQSTPLVNDGMMYIVDGWGAVYKVDVTNPMKARVVWVMDPGVDKADVWLPANRGVALYKDMVVSVTADGKVNWTKDSTGELVKTVQVDDPKNGYSITAAPLVIDDKLIVGGSGGDRGARAHIDALNADTGAPIWRTYTVPAPGEPGSETWKGNNNAWQHGGGSYWQTGGYDPDTKLTIWGTGQPVPMFDPESRPGDNLFTNSSVGFDVATGKMKWYFQYTPGDFMDYDEIGINQLIDTKVNGENRKIIAHFGRNGFFYTLDRTNGQFISGQQYIDKVNWTDGIDPKTGKPLEYDPNKDLQVYKTGAPSRREQGKVMTCPNIQGGVNYFPTTYSPKTGLSYGAGIEGCSDITAKTLNPDGEGGWLGGLYANSARQQGGVSAMNPSTGAMTKHTTLPYSVYSGITATAGGLLFTTSVDGTIYALDDMTLEPLWSFNTGSLSSAPPMAYAVDGKEYIAVLIGGSANAKAMLTEAPETADIQNTSMLYVFSL